MRQRFIVTLEIPEPPLDCEIVSPVMHAERIRELITSRSCEGVAVAVVFVPPHENIPDLTPR